jgi:hypothetical protein
MPFSKRVKFSSTLEESHNKLWGAHIPVPESIARRLTGAGSRRVLCSLNDTEERQCALVPFGDGTYVITVNKSLRDRLHLSFGMDVQIKLRKDESTYGLPMPDELEELLRQDKEGNRFFSALTPGRRRTLLYAVGSAKKTENRLARAVIIVQHLKLNRGKINYKQLSVSMRKR